MTTTITQKGQITIPIEFRRKLNLEKGTPCTFMVRGNELVLIPLKKNMTVEDYQELFRQGLSSSEEFIARKKEEKALEL